MQLGVQRGLLGPKQVSMLHIPCSSINLLSISSQTPPKNHTRQSVTQKPPISIQQSKNCARKIKCFCSTDVNRDVGWEWESQIQTAPQKNIKYTFLYFCSQMNEFRIFLTNCDAGNQCPIKAIRANRQKTWGDFDCKTVSRIYRKWYFVRFFFLLCFVISGFLYFVIFECEWMAFGVLLLNGDGKYRWKYVTGSYGWSEI